jgi:hypothetical protein
MGDVVEEYLDAVLRQARLPRSRARAVRGELKDHLSELVEESELSNPSEIRAMLEEQFGQPAHIGRAIQASYPAKSRTKRWLIRCAVAAALLLGVRATVAEVFYTVGDSVAPQVPAGSRCLVYKLSAAYRPGDVIAYHPDSGTQTWLGVVKDVNDSTGAVTIGRNRHADTALSRWQIVGRVVANTR